MKRYTGQQALYEAISRSRDKAKQHGILEKLRPGPSKPETPANQEPQPAAEPEQASERTPESVVDESPEPQAVDTPAQSVIELPLEAEPEPEIAPEPVSEISPPPVARVEPVLTPRPIERVGHVVPPSPVRTWLKPRPVQFNEGRIEVSVPYYVGAIAALVLLVVVLAAYRIGQGRQSGPANDAGGQAPPAVNPSGTRPNPAARTTPQNTATSNADRPLTNTAAVPAGTRQDAAPTRGQGDNCIVLAFYKTKEDLEPAEKHFAEHGIPVITVSREAMRQVLVKAGLDPGRLPPDEGFLLVTSSYYASADIPGMKLRIAEVGKLYKGKAPAGRESFAPNYFSDAYGMKVR